MVFHPFLSYPLKPFFSNLFMFLVVKVLFSSVIIVVNPYACFLDSPSHQYPESNFVISGLFMVLQ